MSSQGGNLIFVDGIVNAKLSEQLENELLPSIPKILTEYGVYIFQQDGAAKIVTKWLEENQIPCLKWHSNSPDLSLKYR